MEVWAKETTDGEAITEDLQHDEIYVHNATNSGRGLEDILTLSNPMSGLICALSAQHLPRLL